MSTQPGLPQPDKTAFWTCPKGGLHSWMFRRLPIIPGGQGGDQYRCVLCGFVTNKATLKAMTDF